MNKFRKSAQGEECLVRLPGICNFDSETVVLAHLPWGLYSGMGRKAKDIQGTYACSACHDVIDGRSKIPEFFGATKAEIKVCAYEGHMRTLERMLQKGVLKL